MDVRAILLIGGKAEASSEHFTGVPLAMLDLLGASLLNRVTHRMHQQGINSIAVISEYDQFPDRHLSHDLRWFKATNGQFWRFAEAVFNDFAQNGAELIVVLRLSSYITVDYEKLVQFHLDHHSRLTRVCDQQGEALDLFVISASRRNDAAFIFRNMFERFRVPPDVFVLDDNQNRLQTVADFRRLALESFTGKNGIEPHGEQIKPGVWVAPGARVHRDARIVAPAYLGAYARVRALAVITRGSVVERNAEIDCGTVVENSTVLPFSRIGAGLDVSFSVVGFRHIYHLQREVAVEVADAKAARHGFHQRHGQGVDRYGEPRSLHAAGFAFELARKKTGNPGHLARGNSGNTAFPVDRWGRASRSRRSSFCTRVDGSEEIWKRVGRWL